MWMGTSIQNSDSKAKNTFVVINKKNTISIKWYFVAEDTTRIRNHLQYPMRIGEDDSQFYWTYLGHLGCKNI